MANGRGDPRRRKDAGRDPGGFVAIPWAVLDSEAYKGLSHPAKALMMEVARQFHGDDNGRMLLSGKYLATRGWCSNDVISRAKRELIDAGLIFETVKGQRPNKAGWFAVTWRKLDRIAGFDPGVAAAFEQGVYRKGVSNAETKNASLTPPAGVRAPLIAPSAGVGSSLATPPPGAMRSLSGGLLTPPDGDPLEKPSGDNGERTSLQGGSGGAFDLLAKLRARTAQRGVTS